MALRKLGRGVVNTDDLIAAQPTDNDMEIEVTFKAPRAGLLSGPTVVVRIGSDDPRHDLEAFMKDA